MKIGDVVRHEGRLWKVSGHNQEFGVFVLIDSEAARTEVASDDCLEVVHSTSDWPFVALPTKAFRYGRVVRVLRNGVALRPLVDWAPSDMLRAGGSLFFNPDLSLKPGETLVAHYEKGRPGKVPITKAFGSIQQRKNRKPWKPAEPVTVYDRLSGIDLFDDEEED